MRFTLSFLLLALFAALCLAATPQKQVIISYPEDTPQYILDQAKAEIIKAHEFSLIKGFVAKLSTKAIETVQALGSSNGVLIEEDQTVHTNA
ncbi:hypothetical protein B0A54_04246 [Friedmanniomyces endolithicus]|uniref:Inhibitor I9 domain-containing protein n=1 Tax=Friedmanniomyces endolithicus TaxID=329885 RepID=A0A4U0V8H1_9PEZI|nr:hypothetical protein B0A54_04246 [Friedmanniomyces endolithicus]